GRVEPLTSPKDQGRAVLTQFRVRERRESATTRTSPVAEVVCRRCRSGQRPTRASRSSPTRQETSAPARRRQEAATSSHHPSAELVHGGYTDRAAHAYAHGQAR